LIPLAERRSISRAKPEIPESVQPLMSAVARALTAFWPALTVAVVRIATIIEAVHAV